MVIIRQFYGRYLKNSESFHTDWPKLFRLYLTETEKDKSCCVYLTPSDSCELVNIDVEVIE